MPEETMAKGYEPKEVEDKWYEYWLGKRSSLKRKFLLKKRPSV